VIEPKRRGRPPGVKNRVSALEIGRAVEDDLNTEIVPLGSKVVVLFGAGFSKGPQIVNTTWPAGWPMPQLNDVVKAGGISGRVRYIEYDVDENLIRITAV